MLNPPLLLVGQVTLEVTRSAATAYVAGRAVVDGTPTTVFVKANVQPVLKSTDTYLLPEGDRSRAVLKVYTNDIPLRQLREGVGGWAADRFYWDGELYEVMKVIEYKMGVLNHGKALCSRVELT